MMDKQKKPNTQSVPKTDVSESEDKSTKRFVFWMVALTVLLILIGGPAIYWLVTKYVEQSNKNKSQDITIGLLEQKKRDLAALKPNYEKIIAKGSNSKSEAELILNAMPETQAYDQLIAMIERMAGESGGKVITISSEAKDTSDGSENTGQSSYNVVVNYDGGYNQTLDFLKKTEKSSRVMDFVSMSLGGGIGGSKISPTMTFKVYYQGPADINPKEEPLK